MTKTEIMQAAFRVWGSELYVNTSLSRLAGELGVSKPALYRHFKSKQALLDAMTEYFFDDYAALVRDDFKRAAECTDRNEGLLIAVRAMAGYFARNPGPFIFSLINVYDREAGRMAEPFINRGMDMTVFFRAKDDRNLQIIFPLIIATLTFYMAVFHKQGNSLTKPPSERAIKKIISEISEIIAEGFGFSIEGVDALDYKGLEGRLAGMVCNVEEDTLLRAVAGAVAEAGPWNASMDMVARRSGLSKSSLYGHFKNKQDMLRQLFMTEFKRLIAFAKEGIGRSSLPGEQLYLGLFSITDYLRYRTELLVAMDWMRTRRLHLGPPEKPEIPHIFDDVDLNSLSKPGNAALSAGLERVTQQIIFSIISILMFRPEGGSFADVPNASIRVLYRFLTLGLKGFQT